ncbi:MAG: hypothetical protein P8J87_15760, partial [Verrucomicrobiales bacterium]|nr:hypothetical protein [Verrucomicrobiales bacterium]
MKLPTLAILLASLAATHADELGYTIHDILTASSPTPSRSKQWKPGTGIPLEIGGMDWTADGRLAVALRKGDVWLLDNVLGGDPDKITYHRFASGLHEPLGLLRDGDDLLVTQRTELTRLRDTDGDSVADAYLTESSGWNVSGSYHGYAYGPRRDGRGNLWLALNLDMGDHSNNAIGFRGWAGTAAADGTFTPAAA